MPFHLILKTAHRLHKPPVPPESINLIIPRLHPPINLILVVAPKATSLAFSVFLSPRKVSNTSSRKLIFSEKIEGFTTRSYLLP
ncbi:hypothetical protein L1887_33359 [Cichorium endivia]|nr:hypothetical protein L1887_33359 [Cichorium endivia]